jgi:DNA invertase Pin-like site-specific DNA recombinase
MTEKVQRGQAVSVPAFGYDIVDKKYIINEANAHIVRKIFNDYLNGVGCISIAKELNSLGIKTTRGNLWENRTVEYVLQNPVYIGKIRWNTKGKTHRNYADENIIISDGIHEPIVSEEIFNKVQDLIAYNKKKHSHYSHSEVKYEYMLHGLVKCSDCGASLSMSAKGQGLQCIKYTKGNCKTSHYISLNKINELVLIGIEQAFTTGKFKLNIKSTSPNREETIDYNALIEKEKLKLERVKAAYAEGIYTIDELRDFKSAIEEQIKSLTNRQKSAVIDEKALREKLIKENKPLLKQLRNPNVSEQEKNEILKGFIDKVVFDRENSRADLFFYA